MKESVRNEKKANLEGAVTTPVVTMQQGSTTYQLGLYFNKNGKESLGDKVKRLIRKELMNES